MIVGYVVRTKDKRKYLGIDMSSGGYPWLSDNFDAAKQYLDPDSAMKDASRFGSIALGNGGFDTVPVSIPD